MLSVGKYVWASPASLLGLTVGLLGLCAGGGVRCREGVLGFSGRLIDWIFDRIPIQPMAMTLGHVVLGRTPSALDITHDHEMVHVHQYERWGPFLIPAYLLCSLWLILTGRDSYRDNPFEREAFLRVPQGRRDFGKDAETS